MAQLVKLQDYVSRYQIDLKRYPTQFVRLKKMQWDRTKHDWETGDSLDPVTWEQEETFETNVETEMAEQPKKKGLLQRFNIFKQKKDDAFELREEEEVIFQREEEEEIPEEQISLNFEPNLLYEPSSEKELRKMYMDQLYHFQLKWASSTLREKSPIEPKYQRDTLLRDFIQQLPDTYFVFYEPIFLVRKAPIELGVIIVTPTDCYCIEVIEEEDHAIFTGESSDRFWKKMIGKIDKRTLNPLIGLNRMESIVQQYMKLANVEMKVHKVVLSRNGYIDFPGSLYGFEFIDQRNYYNWFAQMKKNPSPMKHLQFQLAETLLAHVQTTAYNRADWYKTDIAEEALNDMDGKDEWK